MTWGRGCRGGVVFREHTITDAHNVLHKESHEPRRFLHSCATVICPPHPSPPPFSNQLNKVFSQILNKWSMLIVRLGRDLDEWQGGAQRGVLLGSRLCVKVCGLCSRLVLCVCVCLEYAIMEVNFMLAIQRRNISCACRRIFAHRGTTVQWTQWVANGQSWLVLYIP